MLALICVKKEEDNRSTLKWRSYFRDGIKIIIFRTMCFPPILRIRHCSTNQGHDLQNPDIISCSAHNFI